MDVFSFSVLRRPHRPLHRVQLPLCGRVRLLLHPAVHAAHLQEEAQGQGRHAQRVRARRRQGRGVGQRLVTDMEVTICRGNHHYL